MNMSTSPTSSMLVSSPPTLLSTTTADTNELMKKIDYFIKVNLESIRLMEDSLLCEELCGLSNRCVSIVENAARRNRWLHSCPSTSLVCDRPTIGHDVFCRNSIYPMLIYSAFVCSSSVCIYSVRTRSVWEATMPHWPIRA